MAEHISCNNHIYFNSIDSEPVHAQKLGKKRIPMTLHNKLQKQNKKQEWGWIYFTQIYIYTFLKMNQRERTYLFIEYVFAWRQTFEKSCQKQTLQQEAILLLSQCLKNKILNCKLQVKLVTLNFYRWCYWKSTLLVADLSTSVVQKCT